MAKPTNKEEFKEYCLRKLGSPVTQINVSEEQVDDRVDEAMDFWNDYHYNGSEHVYLKHQITQEDVDAGYITLPARLLGITRIFNIGASMSLGSGMFNAQYQFSLNNMDTIAGYDIKNYYMSMQHLQFMQEVLVGIPILRYTKHVNKLHIDMNWNKLPIGGHIIVEAYDIIDGDEYSDMWSDRWLQNYATVLIKEQWGSNLTKFTNMQLVGGVQFNGEQILNDAREERLRIEETAIASLQPMVHNFTG